MRHSLTCIAAATLCFTAAANANHLNNNDRHSQFGWFNTDAASKHYMGGSSSSAKNFVSERYEGIVGGHNIETDKIEPLLAAVLGGGGWKGLHGLEGVELGFITPNSAMLRISDWTGINDSLLITGAELEGIIQSLSGGNTDIKNSKSQFAEFFSSGSGSIWIGGGKSNAVQLVGQEFGDITGGSRIHCNARGKKEVAMLFDALTSGSGWSAEKHGLAGVELKGLTPDSFTISYGAAGPTTDRIMFTGSCATDAIEAANYGSADFKDSNSRFVIFDTDAEDSVYLAGTNGGNAFRTMVGNYFDKAEAVEVFNQMVVHLKSGIDGVTLIGVTDDSYAIAVKQNSYITNTFLVKGQVIKAAIDARKPQP